METVEQRKISVYIYIYMYTYICIHFLFFLRNIHTYVYIHIYLYVYIMWNEYSKGLFGTRDRLVPVMDEKRNFLFTRVSATREEFHGTRSRMRLPRVADDRITDQNFFSTFFVTTCRPYTSYKRKITRRLRFSRQISIVRRRTTSASRRVVVAVESYRVRYSGAIRKNERGESIVPVHR